MDQSNDVETAPISNVAAAPAAPPASLDATFERARVLLMELGPADALRVLGGISGAIATKAREESGDEAVARTWGSWSTRMERLASAEPEDAEDDASDEEDDEEEESDDDTEEVAEARPARKERSKMRRQILGMFDVGPRVESCRLREVNALGGLGETLGFANAQGIEETEWPLAAMTPEVFSRLTKRGGKFRFEWFGRDDSGARVALGRSRTFKAQGDEVKEPRKREMEIVMPAPAPVVVAGGGIGIEQLLAILHHNEERSDREKARQLESERHREAMASQERIEKMKLEAEIVKTRGNTPGGYIDPNAPLTAATVAAIIDQKMNEHFSDSDEEEEEEESSNAGDSDDLGLPKWVKAIGINDQIVRLAAPILKDKIIALAANLGPMLAAGAGPGVSPYTAPPGSMGEGGAQ